MKDGFRVLCLIVAMFVCGVAFAARMDPLDMPLPELEVIPGANYTWVGRQMAHNGMPLSIRTFTYHGSEDQVYKFYSQLWKSKGHGETKVRNLGEYRAMVYELRGYIYSVQYRQVGVLVEGKLTVSPVPGRYRHNMKTRFPIPSGCELLNKVESLDYGKRAETLTINCKKRVSYLEGYYQSALKRENWGMVSHRPVNLGVFMDFQRGHELVQITIKQFTQKNKRLVNILVNWIK